MRKRFNHLFLPAVVLLISIQACKKDDPVAPYPKTFVQQGSSRQYAVWINHEDATDSYLPEYFFDPGLAAVQKVKAFSFTLLDYKRMHRANDTVEYFFRNDSLYFYDNHIAIGFTDSLSMKPLRLFAIGNFEELRQYKSYIANRKFIPEKASEYLFMEKWWDGEVNGDTQAVITHMVTFK